MFSIPQLPFGYADLVPYLDEETLHVHYDKHHQTYLTKLNAAAEGTKVANMHLDDVIKQANSLSKPVKNNGGGVWNHSFYWACMGKGKNQPSERMRGIVEKSFGSWEKFQEEFNNTGMNVFGSGWVWLEKTAEGGLAISTTANQDNPMNERNDAHLVLTCDVWEHAYYIQYRNLRADYLKNFWEVINWEAVESHYDKGYSHGA